MIRPDPADSQIRRRRPARARAAGRRHHAGHRAPHRRHDRDDVCGARHRAGRAAGRRAAAHLRRRRVDRPRSGNGLLVMINPEFVERDGMQLEEEGCLSVPGFNATVVRPVARRRQGARSHRDGADARRHGAAGAGVSARDGSSRRHAVRRSAARHQARPDRAENPEAHARRKMVARACASSSSARRHSRCRRSTRCSRRHTRSSAS